MILDCKIERIYERGYQLNYRDQQNSNTGFKVLC